MTDEIDMTIDTPNYFGIVPKEFKCATKNLRERAMAFYLSNILKGVPGYSHDGLTQLSEDLMDS